VLITLWHVMLLMWLQVPCTLPKPPSGRKWCRVVDTNLAPPKDFTPGGNAGVDSVYGVAPHSAIVLLAKPT
jgi:isoamylase